MKNRLEDFDDEEVILSKLEAFYDYNVPEYVLSAGKSYLTINFSHEWDDSIQTREVSMEDVARYYADEADNISSDTRTLAGFSGEWRHIDNLAKEALEWFKYIDLNGIRDVCKYYHLTPRF